MEPDHIKRSDRTYIQVLCRNIQSARIKRNILNLLFQTMGTMILKSKNTAEDSVGLSDIDHFYVYLCCPECDSSLDGVTRIEVEA
jgi:hypothetical protein